MKDYKQLLMDCEERDDEEVMLTENKAERTPKQRKKKLKYNEIFEIKKLKKKK
jgi:hypothetical protein